MVTTRDQTRVESVDKRLNATQEKLHQEIGTLKEEMLAMNKRFDQRFDQLLKLQEESTRATAALTTRKAKEALSPRMERSPCPKGPSISGEGHCDL